MVKDNKNVPEGIWILAIWNFFGAFILLMAACYFILIIDNLDAFNLNLVIQGIDPMTMIQVILVASLFSALTAFAYFIARGLLKAQNWTRIILAIFAALGVVFALVALINDASIATGLLGVAVNGLILWYLLKKDSVKQYFK